MSGRDTVAALDQRVALPPQLSPALLPELRTAVAGASEVLEHDRQELATARKVFATKYSEVAATLPWTASAKAFAAEVLPRARQVRDDATTMARLSKLMLSLNIAADRDSYAVVNARAAELEKRKVPAAYAELFGGTTSDEAMAALSKELDAARAQARELTPQAKETYDTLVKSGLFTNEDAVMLASVAADRGTSADVVVKTYVLMRNQMMIELQPEAPALTAAAIGANISPDRVLAAREQLTFLPTLAWAFRDAGGDQAQSVRVRRSFATVAGELARQMQRLQAAQQQMDAIAAAAASSS